jgi:Transglycosylase SLT domain/SPOR domain
MRALVISAVLLASALTAAHGETSGTPVPAAAPAAPASSPPSSANTVDMVCQRIESAALMNGLPLEFLTRLIWQESRFDEHAISRAGAQGIAQFMPKTAQWVGLGDPFDASEAIGKSAALLRNLRAQFGNLGLAAAAYNAGPKRVTDWLERRRTLPHETLAYVRIVTGHAADEWTAIGAVPTPINLTLPEAVPCPQIVKLFGEHRGSIAAQQKAPTPLNAAAAAPASSAPPSLPWGVQLIGGPSQPVALASFYQMQKTYRSVLGSRQPMVLRSSVGASGSWYRVRIGADNRNDAERLCSNLRAVGGSCLVQPN